MPPTIPYSRPEVKEIVLYHALITNISKIVEQTRCCAIQKFLYLLFGAIGMIMGCMNCLAPATT